VNALLGSRECASRWRAHRAGMVGTAQARLCPPYS
jgi:hypothetical protein